MSDQAEDRALVPISPRVKPFVTALMMLASMLVVIDQTIAVVALPHMQASLGATPDTISWVLTSYILAGALGTPMAGWITGRFGRTRFFGFMVVGFVISSMACGFAVSLPMMVISRIAQGFCGAFMVPMSQAFLYDFNPPSQHVRAITIWSLGTTVAPILGPLIGGYLTDMLSWRWVFFINVPIGIITAAGIFLMMPEFPAVRRAFDRIGYLLIGMGLCGLQLALDRGTQQDWFESTEIVIELGISAAAFWMLFFYLPKARNPLIPPRLFANRNFVAAMVAAVVIMPIATSGMALIPPMMQTLMGYPVQTAALMMLPRAIALTVALTLGGKLMNLIDARIQVSLGMVLIAWSLHMQTGMSLEMDSSVFIWSGVVQAFGTGIAMNVLNYTAVRSAPADIRTEAAAVYMLARNIGASIGIAVVSACLARNLQINHAEVGAAMHSGGTLFHFSEMFGGMFLAERVAAMANVEITRQSMMIAYIDDFWLMMWFTLIGLPAALLIRPQRGRKKEIIALGE